MAMPLFINHVSKKYTCYQGRPNKAKGMIPYLNVKYPIIPCCKITNPICYAMPDAGQ
jgi:hypothetical protein